MKENIHSTQIFPDLVALLKNFLFFFVILLHLRKQSY